MHHNIAIITFIASANALMLESKLQAEYFDLGDLGDGLLGYGEDLLGYGGDLLGLGGDVLEIGIDYGTKVGGNLLGSAQSGLDYVVSGDVLDDIEYVFSADFGEDLLNLGDSLVTGELFVDGYEWASNGESWGALGKVTLATGLSLMTGDVEQAWNIATNWDLYDPNYPEKKMREAYENYKKNFEDKLRPQVKELDDLKASKAATCSTAEPAVGEKAYTYMGRQVNYSQYLGYYYGMQTMGKFYQYYGGSPT